MKTRSILSVLLFSALLAVSYGCRTQSSKTSVPNHASATVTSGSHKTQSTDTVAAKTGNCTDVHEENCHNGGKGATSCSIDGSYYSCLGGYGGSCTVECVSGTYACCGRTCYCKPYGGSW